MEKDNLERLLDAMDAFREGDEDAFDGMTIRLDGDDKESIVEKD